MKTNRPFVHSHFVSKIIRFDDFTGVISLVAGKWNHFHTRAKNLSIMSHHLQILEPCRTSDDNIIANRKFTTCYIKIVCGLFLIMRRDPTTIKKCKNGFYNIRNMQMYGFFF